MARKTIGLHTHIWNNNLLSLVMLFVLPLTLFMLTLTITILWFNMMDEMVFNEAVSHGFTLVIANAHILFAAVSIWYIIAWFFNKRIILQATGAKLVTRTQEKRLYNLLENLAISRSIPMPQLAIIETSALNAFASGIDNSSYTVTVTRGLMTVLDDDELEAVLAHELSHIQNNDVRLMVIISIFAGMIGIITTLAKSLIFPNYGYHSGYGISSHRSSYSSHGRSSGQFFMFLLAVMAASFLASVISNLVKLYISRRREFMADAGAVKLTQNPAAMVRALRKIEGESSMPSFPSAVAEMCISPSAMLKGAFSTHPTTDSRVEALKEIAGYGLSEEDYKVDQEALNQSLNKAQALSPQSNHLFEPEDSSITSSNEAMPVGAQKALDQALANQGINHVSQSDTANSPWNEHLNKKGNSTTIPQELFLNRLGGAFGTRTTTTTQQSVSENKIEQAPFVNDILKNSAKQHPEEYAEVYLKQSSSAAPTKKKQVKQWGNSAKKQWGNITQNFQPKKAIERS